MSTTPAPQVPLHQRSGCRRAAMIGGGVFAVLVVIGLLFPPEEDADVAVAASDADMTTTTEPAEPEATTTEPAEPKTTTTTENLTPDHDIDLQAVMDHLDETHGLRNSECGEGRETNYGKGPTAIAECEFGGNSSMLLFANEQAAIEYTLIDFNTKRPEQYLRYGPIIYNPGGSYLGPEAARERGPTIVAATGFPAVGHGGEFYEDMAAEINADT